MQDAAKGCTCPPNFPVCVCGKKPKVKIITKKVIRPTDMMVATDRDAPSRMIAAKVSAMNSAA